jgi:large subunit GTPase 1
LAKAENEARSLEDSDDESAEEAAEEQGESSGQQEQEGVSLVDDEPKETQINQEAKAAKEADEIDTQILTVEELEGIFLKHAPADAGKKSRN